MITENMHPYEESDSDNFQTRIIIDANENMFKILRIYKKFIRCFKA